MSSQEKSISRPSLPSRISNELLSSVPIDFLVVYRIGFGLVMCWWAVEYLVHGVPFLNYIVAPFHFTYPGFSWVKPWDLEIVVGGIALDGMTLHFIGLAVTALMIAFGLWFRTAAILFGSGYLYWFLLDKAYYLNHYYLCSILGVMLALLPAHRAFSVDAWKRPRLRSQTVGGWALWLLRLQIGVPYFFGGIAKMNADWLRGQPMRTTLSRMSDHPWVSRFPFEQEYLVQSICWGGLIFDLSIVPLLLIRRTRPYAFAVACCFHVSNAFLWNIGIFPWLMILATTVFFEPDWPRRVLRRVPPLRRWWPAVSKTPTLGGISAATWKGRLICGAFLGWVAIQVLIPLRVFVSPGNPSWSEYAHHFSWHMLLRAKETGLRVYATDPKTGRSGTIDLRNYVTARQLSVVGRDPRLIHQLCLFIAEDLETKGFEEIELRALALASLNGRKPQPMIDPSVDLAKEPRDLRYPDWILELREPYRHDAWDFPLAEWEQRLELDVPPQMRLASAASSPPSPDTRTVGARDTD